MQLKMVFLVESTPMPELKIAEGFRLRNILDEDLAAYNELRTSVEFPAWEPEYLIGFYRNKVLEGGFFLIEEIATGRFAASTGAETTDIPELKNVGVMGWVMCHPDFRGKSLGKSASVAAMQRLAQAGYKYFMLSTDDFRLPALKTYLNLGWRPWLFMDDMEGRWRAVAEKLNMSFDSMGCLPADFDFSENR